MNNQYLTWKLASGLILAGIGCLHSLFPLPNAIAQDSFTLENRVKAAYIYNFLKFIDWPDPLETHNPYRVCLMGRDKLGGALDGVVHQKAKFHNIVFDKLKPEEEYEFCHILIISETHLANRILGAQKKHLRPIVLVSDNKDFVHAGGTIGLVTKEGKVRIEINLCVAKQSGIKISANLLEFASRVIDKECE